MAKNKYIETPEKMLEMWQAYKQDAKANPRYKYELDRKGALIAIPLEIPLTQESFEAYCYTVYNVCVGQYFDNPDGRYDEYIAICSRIRTERRADQIIGGMVGQYNASITQRLNGLSESVKADHTSGGEKINIISLGNGIKPE